MTEQNPRVFRGAAFSGSGETPSGSGAPRPGQGDSDRSDRDGNDRDRADSGAAGARASGSDRETCGETAGDGTDQWQAAGRPLRVPGPNGVWLTMSALPPPDTRRWVARRKAEVLAAISGGLLTAAEACVRYRLSPEELEIWQEAIDRAGVPGLRVTRIQIYREADRLARRRFREQAGERGQMERDAAPARKYGYRDYEGAHR